MCSSTSDSLDKWNVFLPVSFQVHLRQVSSEEGEILAADMGCKFFELSAAEHVHQVSDAFVELCRDILTTKRKSKQSFIDKIDRMLGGNRVYNRGKSDSALPKET